LFRTRFETRPEACRVNVPTSMLVPKIFVRTSFLDPTPERVGVT